MPNIGCYIISVRRGLMLSGGLQASGVRLRGVAKATTGWSLSSIVRARARQQAEAGVGQNSVDARLLALLDNVAWAKRNCRHCDRPLWRSCESRSFLQLPGPPLQAADIPDV